MRKNEDSLHESSMKELITKIAMRKVGMKTLYDDEIEKKILSVLKEKQSKVYEIKRMKDILEFL